MNPDKGPMQKLLMLEEYSDLEDIVVVEASFVELDKCGDAVQQVVIGISPDHLFLGRRHILNWKEDPVITSDLNADLQIYDLELKWVTPLRYVDISTVREDYILKISAKHTRCRYFEMCTARDRDANWGRWLDRIRYLKDDPYGYVSKMRLRRNSEESLSSVDHGLSSGYSSESQKSGSGDSDKDANKIWSSGGEA